jgi:two-component system alkaline phosphatase synthesis response regulator PhoP
MSDHPLFLSALLVEDEPHLQTALEVALRKLGISSYSVSTLEAARQKLQESSAEFILLDRNLPDGDGLTLCKELRKQGFSGSILMLTAIGQIEDRVLGLNSGADDYLPKPFSWEELEARIRALARRRPIIQPQASSSTSSLWHIDANQLRILGPKGWITLTPLEFKLAQKLIQDREKIVSRDDLLKDVWGFNFLPKTRTVDHFLGRLRKHFEQSPDDPKHFLTIRGAGYKFQP